MSTNTQSSETVSARLKLEAEIADFLRQRIEDGNLCAEDVPARLARYGLMPPETFVSEMRERMGLDDGDEAAATVSTAVTHRSDFGTPVMVACVNASGMPDMPVFIVSATQEEYDLGVHYDKAEALAEESGYEGPFVCFDMAEQEAIVSAARELGLVPQVVVVDMTDGQIHSIRCDSGEIKVVCYDTSDTDEHSAAVANRPLGENGQLVRCWSHAQLAQVDPGLKPAQI
ncbi:hypothetical protein QYG06_10095 [Xanthomonas euvesicatoria]|uniref:Uncharacterized protein n=3 Tax=Lysobacterales TaxID=135614 RepID=Q3BSZ7_XANE5|nr:MULTISPECIES: hypothetical protein [Pseudomonadota]ABM41631.1 conserved hypothetical protein [Acidovorax sp. JS42]AOY65918.1 hypothetical protein BHE83_04620 [Xanthomonas euvesicatoria pv. vesicatoria str. 85-10]KLB39173.1 hypothetical protein XEUV206_17280 [Xanthomonas euvesicatoria]MCC8581133.1 hypothetical protein [Xanthomonas euvesicatoria pv. euvesicatoria]MCC8583927.1 hypothetical protein [Xanthomonas euvesicatoria pv. euvesicatoria]